MPEARNSPGANIATPTKDIRESIGALRSILMLDTPTNSLLSGSHPTVAAQQSQYDISRKTWDELATLRSKTLELKTKVQDATTEAEQEARKRKTLQSTYDALTRQRKELSVQLELITKSRDAAEEKLAIIRKSLNEERAAVVHEQCQWRPRIDELKAENEKLETRQKDLEAQCLVSGTRVRELESKLAQQQRTMENISAELRSSQEWLAKQMGDHREAVETEKKLATAQEELHTIKRRHQKSLGSMLQIQQSLKSDLQNLQTEKKSSEELIAKHVEDLNQAEKAKEDAIIKLQTEKQASKETIAKHLDDLKQAEKAKDDAIIRLQIEKKASEESIAKYLENLEQAEKAKDDAIIRITQTADESERDLKMKISLLEEKVRDGEGRTCSKAFRISLC